MIFAGLVEPARFPMLTLTLLGFLTAARVTTQRLPLGSFVLFVIGTLLIPIDAAIFFALINTHASLLYWGVIAAGMSLLWAGEPIPTDHASSVWWYLRRLVSPST